MPQTYLVLGPGLGDGHHGFFTCRGLFQAGDLKLKRRIILEVVPIHPTAGHGDEAHLPSTADWPEWRSSRLRFDLLLLQLILTIVIGGAILWLAQYSRVHDGFIRLGSPPAFISDNPDLMKAIWTQSWQYTTLPVSLMTLYRVSWDGVIAAIAERQPYVELMKVDGSPPAKHSF
ncbi:hypothetical protein QBC37DRAFT_427177 [Rhypophila decipiens]|uniref:Uncharacterized protein n=1 Tax=Rhypophila decipiens TaxID=261697 RepID=A0AAN6Y290_9PEZI|nr:hypothetical protein QBC37DRAFT_427177 [Rhypophila decipiens]